MRRRTAALFVAVGALVVALAITLWPAGNSGGGPITPPPPLVEVDTAKREVIEISVRSVGSVEAVESITVTSPVTGTVNRLRFVEGQHVKAGAPLVELDAASQFAALEAARAELQDARSQWGRLSQLAHSGAVSKSTLDQALARFDTARAHVNQSKADLDDRRITAPFAGTVGLAQVSPGAVVEPGDAITTLATVGQLKLAFRLPTQYLPRLRPGLLVRARAQGFDKEFMGQVTRIDNTADPATRSIALEAALPKAGGLKPGLFVTVTVVLERREAVMVPEEAVLLEGENAFVYTVGDDRLAKRQPVQIGERREGLVEVREGIAPGARVMTAGTQKVRPDQPVTLPGSGAPPRGAAP